MREQNKDETEEQEDEEFNPTPVALTRARQQERECKNKLGKTIKEMEEDIGNDEGLGVAPRRSQQERKVSTTLTHNEDFKATEKPSISCTDKNERKNGHIATKP